jgi:hypothetical protein
MSNDREQRDIGEFGPWGAAEDTSDIWKCLNFMSVTYGLEAVTKCVMHSAACENGRTVQSEILTAGFVTSGKGKGKVVMLHAMEVLWVKGGIAPAP